MADIYSSSGNLDNIRLTEAISDVALDTLLSGTVIAPWIKQYDLSNSGSLTFNINTFGTATLTTSLGETADLTSTAFTDSQAQLTHAEVGVMTLVPDKTMNNTPIIDLTGRIGREYGRAIANQMDVDLGALFAAMNGGTDVGTGASTMSVDIFLQALEIFETNNNVGVPAAFFHPTQISSIRQSVAASAATVVDTFFPTGAQEGGFVGNIYGVAAYQTTNLNLASATGGNAYHAAIIATGDDAPIAMGIWRPARIETERDASRRGTEIVGTSAYNVVEQADKNGVPITAR